MTLPDTLPDNPDVLQAQAASPTQGITDDAFLGELLQILQPSKGYRAGIDAVLLAATVPSASHAAAILDCGAGVGTVGLCVAARCPAARVTLIEREPALIDLAQRNIQRNGLQTRMSVIKGDVTVAAQSPNAPSLPSESFDLILANPPYHDEGSGTEARDPLKRMSHAMPANALDAWVRFAARVCRPGGRATFIHKADALLALLAAMQDRFGALTIIPIHPYADKPANRVLVTGCKGSRAPLAIDPPIVLHEAGGGFTPYVGQILRHGAPLTPSRT